MGKVIEKAERILEAGGAKKEIILLTVSGVSLILSLSKVVRLPFDIAWAAIILCGIPILAEAVIGLVKSFDIKADVLVSMALIAAVCIGEDFAAGEVAFIMQLGALLENATVAKARQGIEKLVHLTPQTARVINNGSERIISAQEVKVNDILLVLPGETIPADGIIISGRTSVNQAVMTGESMPVDKAEGDEVSSGTANQFGAFKMRAVRVGEDSSIQRMIKLVQSADAGKAKIVSLADRWATWIVIIALMSAGITWAVSGEIIRAVTILVVFCPCALVLATPTAIMAAIGNAAKRGFLVRDGGALERLAKVGKVTLDKTGTLTRGTPRVIVAESVSDYSDEEIFTFAAAAEQLSEHPLGRAVTVSYRERFKEEIPQASEFVMTPGEGVEATVEGRRVKAGKRDIRAESADKYLREGCTVICITIDERPAGYIALSDMLREESPGMINGLKSLGIKTVLLTGDNASAAETIGKKLDIGEIKANCLPEDKLEYISGCIEKGESVCMVGDGINDAPALKKADVGIAMGGVGSDIAVDAADIVIVDDDIKELPFLISLAKRMMKKIKWNMSFSMALNFLAIILAMSGVLNPVIGALVHNAGSVFVITNSALLLRKRV